MASYQAKIDLIVTGLKEIENAEKRIKNLVRESKKLARGGTAQRGTVALASITREERQNQRRSVQIQERKITLQSKLNAATDLYTRKLEQFNRAGGNTNKQFKDRVFQITQAFAVGTKGGQKNLKLLRALGTELGRLVEKQNELNRLQSLKGKGFEAGRRGFERISAIESAGLADPRSLTRARQLVRGIGTAAQTGDQRLYNEAVRKAGGVLSRLEREYKEAERAQRAATKAKREVERAERKVAAAAKREANEREAKRRTGRRRISDIATGFGFPLLFGGGPGQAIAGGLGGALGGFGGSIAATAIFSQLEQFGGAAIKTGTALRSTSGALELVRENSLFTEQATSDYADELERLGEVEKLSALLTEELVDKIGNKGVIALQDLGTESDKTTRLWGELTVQLQRLIAGPLTGFLKIVNQVLGAITGGQRREAFFADLGPREAEARARFQQLTGQARFGTGRSAAKRKAEAEAKGEVFLTQEEALAQVRKEFAPEVTATIPITAADRKSVKGKTAKDDTEQAFKLLLALQRRQLVLTKITDLEKTLFEIRNKEIDTEARITKFRGITDELREQLRIENERASTAERLDAVLSDALSKTATAYRALKPLDDDIQLLEATLAGKREEFLLEKEIERIRRAAPGLTRESVAAEIEKRNVLREQLTQQKFIEQTLLDTANSAGLSLSNMFERLITDTQNWNEALSDTLKTFAQLAFRAGINILGGGDDQGFFSFLSGGLRANGGPVSSGKSYVVGERGPELFVPRSSGTIVPNDKMMGGSSNVVVNVDASGTKVQGDNNQASQLGKVIGAAVQAELIKQKRPGGLLAGT